MDGGQGRADRATGSVVRLARHRSRLSERRRRTLEAWERFVAGDDDVRGVSPSVLQSWYRCRDLHKVDPGLAGAPKAAGRSGLPVPYNTVFAQLGGIAAGIVGRSDDCVATVTDGEGMILASWGAGPTMREAQHSSLAPSYAWSESAVGTNGIGTALRDRRALSVCGPEHWCESLHGWDCVGVAVYDSVTEDPVAALNVSSREDELPVRPSTLVSETAIVRQGLRERARNNAAEITREFVEATRHTRRALIAVDVAGGVVAANEKARDALGRFPEGLLRNPADRWRTEHPELRGITRRAVRRAQADPRWVGSADLGSLSGGQGEVFEITPISSPDGVVGLLLFSSDRAPGNAERLDPGGVADTGDEPLRRIKAVQDRRILLIPPEEIRYAEAVRHDVWLVTDQGRVRATTHGIEHIERELVPLGFLRVHRSFIVNLARIREIGHHGKGVLTLSTDPQKHEAIPVSRRCVSDLRQRLGL